MSSHSLAFIIAALVVGTTSAIRVSVQAAPSLVRPPATPAPRALAMMQEEAPEAPLTWNTALDADGETYYWNSAGASTYEKPADFDPATAKVVTEKYQAKGDDGVETGEDGCKAGGAPWPWLASSSGAPCEGINI